MRAIFLDRDGVINRAYVRDGKPYPPLTINEVEILPGVKTALEKLKESGFLLVVVTNQPDVSRGIVTREKVVEINEYLNSILPIDEFITCYHDDGEDCECRKPKPGMILDAVEKYNLSVNDSYMVGDRWKDIEAGNNAGCKTIFLDYDYNEKKPTEFNYKVESLYDSVNIILESQNI